MKETPCFATVKSVLESNSERKAKDKTMKANMN
jgi:hypothetical protein